MMLFRIFRLSLLSLMAVLFVACNNEDTSKNEALNNLNNENVEENNALNDETELNDEENTDVDVVDEEEEVEEVDDDESAFEPLTEQEVIDILKNTIVKMTRDANEFLSQYFEEIVAEATDEDIYTYLDAIYYDEERFSEQFSAALSPYITDEISDQIVQIQMDEVYVYVNHATTLSYLNSDNLSMPFKIEQPDESTLNISYYAYGEFNLLLEYLTSKIDLSFTKTEDDGSWKLASVEYEPHILELEEPLTKEDLDKYFELKEYLLGFSYDYHFNDIIRHEGRNLLHFTLYGSDAYVDTTSGLFIYDYFEGVPDVNELISYILGMTNY